MSKNSKSVQLVSNVAIHPVSWAPPEVKSVVLIIILCACWIPCLFSHTAGELAASFGFPCIALYLLYDNGSDHCAPEIIFPALYLLWYWLGNLPVLIDDRALELTTGLGERVWSYALLGLIAYFLGVMQFRLKQGYTTAGRTFYFVWQEKRFILLVITTIIVIFISWLSIIFAEGMGILQENIDISRLSVANHHIALQATIGLGTFILPINFLYLCTEKHPKYKIPLYLCNLFIFIVFLSGGNRGQILPLLLTVFVMHHYLRRPWRIYQIIGIGLVIVPLLSLAGYYRSLQHFGASYVADLLNLGMPLELQPITNIYLYIRAPVETFRNLMLVIPAVYPFQHGSVSMGFFAQLLPGRHPSSDFFFKKILGHASDGYGEPASILGSFYADFGVTGVMLGMFFTGMLTKFIYKQSSKKNLGWLLFYCFLWQKLVGSLYGSLFTYVVDFFIPIAWIAFVPFFVKAIDNNDHGKIL